jgi:hypothetical protein
MLLDLKLITREGCFKGLTHELVDILVERMQKAE